MTATPLRTAREAAGISLPRMAEIIGWDKGNLSRLERGQAKNEHTIECVATRYELALGLEPRALLREVQTLPANLGGRLQRIPGLRSLMRLTPPVSFRSCLVT